MENMKKFKVKLTFTEEILGTANATTTIHDEYIASKAPDAKSREEEIAALGVAEVVEKVHDSVPDTGRRHTISLGLSGKRLLQRRLRCSEKGIRHG